MVAHHCGGVRILAPDRRRRGGAGRAARAQVVVSSSPVAALVISYFENVYLGLPIRSTGNLLPFGTESFEIDTSGWAVETNCALARHAPAVAWAVDNYLAGGSVLAVTASANGNMAARAVDRPVVTPGVEYIAYCYLSPPTSGSAAWVELRFYDATDTQIGAKRSPLAAPGTGYYRQRASAIAPAGAVTCGVAVGVDTATAAQILRVETVVVGVAARTLAGSVIPFADASFEADVAGWTRPSGVAVLTRSTPWGAYATNGSYALTVTSLTATASTIQSAKFPLPAGSDGTSFRLQYSEQVTAGSWTVSRGVRWFDAANTDLGITGSSAAAAPTPGWWYLARDHAVPTGATQAAVELILTAGAVNSVIRLDAVALWQALPLMTVVAQEESASVTLTLRELPVGQLIRVYRVSPDGARTLVRGPSGLYDGTGVIMSDLLVIEDYEAPLTVPVYYVVVTTDPVTLARTIRTSDPVTIPHDDVNEVWLKDPGNPQRNCEVLVQHAPNWTRPIEQATYRVAGRRNAVVHSGIRGGLEGDLQVWTRTDDERSALHWLLDSGNVLLWQAAPGKGVADMYVTIGQATETRDVDEADDPWRAWTLPLTEADMPVTTGVNGSAGRTWQDILSEFDTWQEVLDTFATWEDVFLDRRIEG